MTTFIPIYYEIDSIKGKYESLKFTNNLFNLTVIVSIILSIIGIIFAEQIVCLFAIGFEGYIFDLTVSYTRILLLGIVFIGLGNIMTAFLQTKSNFIIPGIISIPYNLIIIAIILSVKIGQIIILSATLKNR